MAVEMFERLQSDIKQAMKAREKDKLTALRMLVAQLKDVSVNAGKELTEETFIEVTSRAIKQRKDSAEQFKQGGREELAAKEEAEIAYFEAYLPAQLDAAAIEELVRQAIEETGAAGKQDMGKVMGVVMPKVKGKADGKVVNQIVMELLG